MLFLSFAYVIAHVATYALDIAAGLHGDDAHLVLLVEPDQERLLRVVEDAARLGPVAVRACGCAG